MGFLEAITQINASSALAIAIIMSFSSIGTALAFGYLGGQYLNCITRNPEAAPLLQGRFLTVAALIDAISIIGVVLALLFAYNNPLLAEIKNMQAQEQAQITENNHDNHA